MPTTDSPHLALLLQRSGGIARRYFVTNGFDGTLTMLGLIVGFRTLDHAPVEVAVTACQGAALALCISGVSSAYISESAERRGELGRLREAMLEGLAGSTHEHIARWAPVLIAAVNGLAPFVLAQIVMLPLWLELLGAGLPLPAYDLAIGVALTLIFLIGIFLGRVGGTFWLWAALRTLAIGVLTVAVIYLLSP